MSYSQVILMKNKHLKVFLALTSLALIASVLIFCFQYLIRLINTFLNLEKIDSPIYFTVYLVFVIAISILESQILRPPFLKGDLITLKNYIEQNNRIHWLKGICVVFIGCLLSFLIGLPLGGEAPSIFMVALLGDGIFHLFKNKQKELEGCYLGAGLGYSLAFLNPLAGFSYYLEKEKMPLKLKEISKPIYLLLLSFGFLLLWRFLAGEKLFYRYESFNSSILFFNDFNEFYLCLIIPFFALIGAYIFKTCVSALKRDNIVNTKSYYIISTIIASTFVLLIKYAGKTQLLGSGVELLQDLSAFAITDILTFLLVRFLFTTITFNLFYTGGKVIPTISLGALFGDLLVVMLDGYDLSSSMRMLIIITTMLTFYAVVTDAYFTSFFLSFSFCPFYISALPLSISLAIAFIIDKQIKKNLITQKRNEFTFSLTKDKNN